MLSLYRHCCSNSPWVQAARLFLVLFLLSIGHFFSSVIAQSKRVFYVATNGSDSSLGTKSEPFRTLQRAADVVIAGDSVYVREGRYPAFELRNVHGAPGQPIIFTPYFGEAVIIDRGLGGGNGYRAIEIFECSYITIDGFEITDTTPVPGPDGLQKPAGALVKLLDPSDAQHVEIIMQYFIGRNGIKVNHDVNGRNAYMDSHHIILQNLHIHDLVATGILGGGKNIYILNNHIHDIGGANEGYGMYITGEAITIKGNVTHNNPGGHGIRLGTSNEGHLNYSTIENNRSYDNGGVFLHNKTKVKTAGDGIILYKGWHNTFRNNLVYGNINWGIRIRGSYNKVLNNTAYRNLHQGIFVYSRDYHAGSHHNLVRNNISYQIREEQPAYQGDLYLGNGNEEDHNLLGVDPQFINPSQSDFHLAAGSPGIDAGSPVEAPADDLDGVPRPQGAGWDIGAYEYVEGGASNPPGETFYVSTSGADTDPGTIDHPFRTIQKAADQARAGDTILVREGIYEESVLLRYSGDPDRAIVFKNYPNEHPVIAPGTKPAGRRIELRALEGHQHAIGWITIEGFEIRDGWEGIKYYNGHHIVIRGNHIHDNVNQGILGYGHDIEIEGNLISKNGIIVGEPWADQGFGIFGEGKRYLINNNVISSNLAFGIHIAGYDYDSGRHAAPEFAEASDWLVSNNTIAYNSSNAGILISQSKATDCVVQNNIFYMNSMQQDPGGLQGIYFSSGGGHVVRNNIFFGFDGKAIYDEHGGSYVADRNLEADPLMIDTTNHNFRLTSASPAIDAGTAIDAPSADFDKTARPQRSGWDIGAFEYITSGMPVNKPVSPVE